MDTELTAGRKFVDRRCPVVIAFGWICLFSVGGITASAGPGPQGEPIGAPRVLEFEFELDAERVEVVRDSVTGYDRITYEGESPYADPGRAGEPMLPALDRTILLPPGMSVSEFTVITANRVLVAEDVRPIPIPPLEDTGQEWGEDPYYYEQGRVWPDAPEILSGNSAYREFRVADAVALPFEWDSATGDLFLYRSVEIVLDLAPVPPELSIPRRQRRERRLSSNRAELRYIEERAINAGDLGRFYPGISDSTDERSQVSYAVIETTRATGFRPSERPSLQGSPVEMIIITGEEWFDGTESDDLRGPFQELADWRTKTGMPTAVRSVQWIRQHYHGADDPERIRAFLMDCYSLWGTDFVLLGGDYEVVPSRLVLSSDQYLLDQPTDYYYAAYDADWNADGDAHTEYSTEPGADYYPELWVGRVPVRDAVEAEAWVDKLLTYERAPHKAVPSTGYYTGALLAAGLTNSGRWPSWNNGLYIAERLKTGVLDPASFSSARLYPHLATSAVCDGVSDTHPCWSSIKDYFGSSYPTGRLNAASMRDGIDSGNYSIFFHVEHSYVHLLGGPTDEEGTKPPTDECTGDSACTTPGCNAWQDACWDAYIHGNSKGGLYRELAASANNGPAYFIGMSYGSMTGRFDQDSIAETFVRDPDGGAVAWASKSVSLNATAQDSLRSVPFQFFDGLLANHLTCGQALAGALTRKGVNLSSLTWHLFGDPSMRAWSEAPDTLEIAVDPDTLLNPDYYSFTATVSNSSGPVENARVCLTREDDIFALAWTDASGEARFPGVLISQSIDPITVWAVGSNVVPESTLIAGATLTDLEDDPALIYDRHSYDDAGDPGYQADLLEAGDRFDLEVRLLNVSAAEVPAGNVTLCPTPRVRAWIQENGVHANESVWIGRNLGHPPAMADTFHLSLNEYGIRPEFPPASYTDYGYYVYRDTTFTYHFRAHYDPSLYGDTLSGAFAAEGGVTLVSQTLEGGDSLWVRNGALGNEAAFSFVADSSDDLFSFRAEAEDWVAVHEDRDHYGAVTPNQTTTVEFDVEFSDTMPPRTNLDFSLLSGGDGAGGGTPVFSDFTLECAAPEPEIASIRRVSTGSDCGAGNDYLMKVSVRNLGDTGIEDAVIRVVSWGGIAVTVCSDTLHIDLGPDEEKETTNGIHYSDSGSFFTPTKIQIENAAGDTLAVMEGTFTPVNHGKVVSGVTVIPSPGGFQVAWTPPSPSSAVLGYHVYADTSGTPFRLTTVPLTEYAHLWAVDLERHQPVGTDPIDYKIGVSVVGTSLSEGSIVWFGTGFTPQTDQVSLAERAGFPVRMPKGSAGTVALVDLDEDEDSEILVGGRVIAAWDEDGSSATANADGTLYDPFPENGTYDQPFPSFHGELAVDDIDDDDVLEIVGCYGNGKVYCVEVDGSLEFSPRSVDSKVTPVIADLDGNGQKEILVHQWNPGDVYVFESDGSAYGPHGSGLFIDTPAANDYTFASLAVGEIDGAVRIVQATTSDKVYVWNAASSGATLHLSRTLSGGKRSTPTIADVDQDGDVDVVVRSAGTVSKSVVAIEGEDSTSVAECCWPEDKIFEDLDLPTNPVAVADLGGDEKLEMVTGGWDVDSTAAADSMFVHLVYFQSGSTYKVATGLDHISVPGRRIVGASTVGYPVLCDWDGDDITEIIIGSNNGGLFCWEPTWNQGSSTFSLKPEKGWPILHRETQGSPAVGDIDGDGFTELVVPTDDGYVHVYDLPGATVAWGAAGYDLRRSGFVPPPVPRPEQAGLAMVTAEISIWGNPFQEEATIRFRSVQPGHVEVLVFDVAGRRIRSLLNVEDLPSGVHEVKWNGRSDRGAPVPSGVYFGVVRTGDFELKKRIVKAG